MAGLSLADKPELATKIAFMRAAGATQDTIAHAVGCDRSVISRTLATPALKERIEIAHQALSNACLDSCVDTYAYLTQNYRNLEGDEKQHSFKATTAVLESLGILASRTPSQLVVNILNANQVVLSPLVQQVVSQVTGCLAAPPDDDEVIDV
jgi:DNA-binding transcriptional regulator LsrR (DeoR family)